MCRLSFKEITSKNGNQYLSKYFLCEAIKAVLSCVKVETVEKIMNSKQQKSLTKSIK